MALCKHDWVDVTPIGSAFMEYICGKCGDLHRQSVVPPSTFSPTWRSSAGVEMRLTKEGAGGGDPYRWSVTRSASPGLPVYVAEYGCGCVWTLDECTLMASSGSPPAYGVELSCPLHGNKAGALSAGPYDPSATFSRSGVVGYAQGSAVSGGSLGVALSAPGSPGYPAPQRVPRPELELTFETEPIIGFRMWRVVTHRLHGGIEEPRLQPLTGRNLWEPRVRFEAVCLPVASQFVYGRHRSDTHEAPDRDCDCGTWAVRDKTHLPTNHYHGTTLAIGEVYLWGRVLEFKKGWRAKYAYPKALTLLADDKERAGELERLYGVAVTCDPPAPPEKKTGYIVDEAAMMDWARTIMAGFPAPVVGATDLTT